MTAPPSTETPRHTSSAQTVTAIPNTDERRQFPLYELAPDFTLKDRDPQADERLRLYRDVFAELTAKAIPVCASDSDDPERVRHYIMPVGPLHRAAGQLGFQLFNGENYLAAATAQIARLTSSHAGLTARVAELEAEVARLTPAPLAWDSNSNRYYEPVELLAQKLYERFDYDGPPGTKKPAWSPHGNGLKMDEARHLARKQLREAGHRARAGEPSHDRR